MWILIAFMAVPLIEIALFISIGGAIGLPLTLAIVILTAVAGTYLVRTQGTQAFQRLQRSFNEFEDPTTPLADGAMILFAGALLLTPGFFTDAVGFALLVPRSRRAIRAFLAARIQTVQFASRESQHGPRSGPTIIDGEYEDVTPDGHRGPGAS